MGGGKLPDRLQKAIAHSSVRLGCDQQRLPRQLFQPVQRRPLVGFGRAADLMRRLQSPAPRKTDSPAKNAPSVGDRSAKLQSKAARRVWCRAGRPCPVRADKSRRCAVLASICEGVSTRVQAAASSIASGRPSNWRHRPATARALPGVIWKSTRWACARSTNNCTLGQRDSRSGSSSASSGSASGQTGSSCSPRQAQCASRRRQAGQRRRPLQ